MTFNTKKDLSNLSTNEVRESEYSFNKNKKTYIIFGIVTLIILFVGSFMLYNNKADKNNPRPFLSPEIISRLQAYSYGEKEPAIGFQQMSDNLDYAKWIVDTFISSNLITFEDNEKFFTDERLVYITCDHDFAVRGILQVKAEDGSITKQDIEFIYTMGEWSADRTRLKVFYKEMRELSK